jgi:hypothetical protein
MCPKEVINVSSEAYKKFQKQIEDIELDHNLADYHAFIFWFIETAFGYPKDRILNSICDGTRDKGVDAVIIDPIELKVIVIQSKYEQAGGQVQISDNEIKLLATVRNYFDSRSSFKAAINKGNQATKRLMNEAFDAVRKKGYTLELAFISTHKNAPHLDDLISDTLGFAENEFKLYHYDRIMQLYFDKMRDFTPSLGVYNLPFVDPDKAIIKTSGYKSWVLTVLAEDIRSLINKHGDKLFRKNVRNFLGKSRTNKKILETLEKDPTNFWYYNNGITILCDKANIIMEKGYIRLENPQIVNGCQTTKSIAKFDGELKGALMVRIVESTNHEFVNFLTLYQNSSNPVRNRDLKSNDPVQIRLKHEFRRQRYYYEIKRGEEYSKMAKKYPALKSEFAGNVLNNELVAKLLAALKMSPAIALSSGSDKFFGDYYDRIFTSNLSTFNCLAPFYIYDFIRYTYKGKTKRFHTFDKDWVFKNRALFYVLDLIYRQLGKHGNWEKKFVSFYEESTPEEYRRFFKKMKKIINKYFEYIYKTWDGIEYYNAYLQNSKTMKRIIRKYRTEIGDLGEETKEIFEQIL